MSISGSQFYSRQNISNTNESQEQYDDLNTRVLQNTVSITELESDVDNLTGVVDDLSDQVSENTLVNVSQDANIASILQRITDINYSSGNDYTTILNRLEIRNPLDSDTSSSPQLTLFNNSTQAANKVIYSIMCGVENGMWSALAREGDCLMLTRDQNSIPGSYLGGMVFCTHGGTSGFRFSYDPAIASVFRSNINLETYNLTTSGAVGTGNITCTNSTDPTINIVNSTTSNGTRRVSFSIQSGVASGSWTNLTQTGDVLLLSRRSSSASNNYTGGIVLANHGNRGFRFSMNPNVASEFRSNINLVGNYLQTTGELRCGELVLDGINLSTTLSDIQSDISTNTAAISTNASNIATNASNISTNTADISANTANIASNTADILTLQAVDHSVLPSDLNASGFDLLNVGEIQSTDLVSNHVLTEDLRVVSTGAGPETIWKTTTLSGECTMRITAPSGTATSLSISTQNTATIKKDFDITHTTINTNDRIISNLNTCMGYYVDMTSISSSSTYSIVPPDYVVGANLITLNSDHIVFKEAGLYRINFGWTHVYFQGGDGAGTDFDVRPGISTIDDNNSPFLNELMDHSFHGVANEFDGYDIVSTNLYPMAVNEDGWYFFRYTTKRSGTVVRPNRWNMMLLAEIGANQKLYFKMKANRDWSTDRHRFVIQRLL